MKQFELTPADEMKDKLWGKIGTPERDRMEAKLKEEVHAYFVGEAIRKARQAQQDMMNISYCTTLRKFC